ncbi:MAG: hypothetical protein JW982_16170 [Spirochaetes bacterium]|nr:hypothetical protein [Spirochaetota bacterium]
MIYRIIRLYFYRFLLLFIVLGVIFTPGTLLFKMPDTLISSEMVNIDSNNIYFRTAVNIRNRNIYRLKISDLTVKTYTPDGTLTDTFEVKGGFIEGNSSNNFISEFSMNLNGIDKGFVRIDISGSAGIVFFGLIKKEMPLRFIIQSNTVNAFESIKSPDVNINVSVKELIKDGISFTGNVEIYNNNKILISVNSIILKMRTKSGDVLSSVKITGDGVKPGERKVFKFKGILPYKFLDEGILFADLEGLFVLKVAGVEKQIPMISRTTLSVPDVPVLFGLKEPMVMKFSSNLDIGIRSAEIHFDYSMMNPGFIVLNVKNLKIELFKKDKNRTVKIDSRKFDEITINAESTVSSGFTVKLPLSDFTSDRFLKILPEKYTAEITCDLSIFNLSQSIPYKFIIDIDPRVL